MKQTAVEWLMQQLPTIDKYDPYYQDLFTKAKEIEKEQIILAHLMARCYDTENSVNEAEQYYKETYESNTRIQPT